MPQRKLFRFLLLAGLGLVAGFLALAITLPLEPQVAAPLIALFSPGLKLAEFVTPETGKSFAWTFGWFLRIAIVANAAFYYALFAVYRTPCGSPPRQIARGLGNLQGWMEFECWKGKCRGQAKGQGGAQLSQECPHRSTSQWEQTTAWHNVFECGRLFRLG